MKRLQHGFSIVTAIFLLVVLAGLGAALVTISTSQNQSSAMDVLGSRAYQAARAGVEYAAYYVINNSTCPPLPLPTSPPLGGTLAPFTVTVTCTSTPVLPVGSDSITNTYFVTSVACNAPNAGACPGTPGNSSYVERSVTSKFGK